MIGLIGIGNDGMTVCAPNGAPLFALPAWLAWRIQRAQHAVARLTHR